MIRLIVYILLGLVIAAGGWWLATQSGQIVIDGFGREISLSLPVGLLGLVLLTLSLFLLWQGLVWLVTLPARLKKMRANMRKEKGYDALESALIAAAAGDTKGARAHAEKVQALMQRPALSGLLAARAAQADGDIAGAERHFEGLLVDKRTSLAARRGLTETALQRNDHAAAIAHAKQAFTSDPMARWAFETLFDALVSARDWSEARSVLAKGEKKAHLSKMAATRRRAVLFSAEAAQLEIDGDLDEARRLAERAVTTAPGFAPGAALAARLLLAAGKGWRAAGLLEDAWGAAPHPALSLAYRDLKEDEAIKDKTKRLKGLAQLNPKHRESSILQAELELENADTATARQHLQGRLDEDGEASSRLCTLMAKLEKQDGNKQEAENWLRRSLTAHDEPDWSDLDPLGAAFGYRAEDWARLVYSFGDAAELIHPRHERFERVSHGAEDLILLTSEDSDSEAEDASGEAEEDAPQKQVKPARVKAKKAKKEPEESISPPSPDDPGPKARADPPESVVTRKRKVH